MFSTRLLALVSLVAIVALPSIAEPPVWPTERNDLLFAFPDAQAPATVFQANGTALPGWKFTPRGYGRVRHDGALELGGGGFTAPEIASGLHDGLVGDTDFTVLFTLQANSPVESGAILSLGERGGEEELVVLQRDAKLEIILAKAPKRLVLLSDTRYATAPFEVAVMRIGHQVLVFRDGVEVDRCELASDPTFRDGCYLSLGAKSPQGKSWWGAVNNIAIYKRALPPGVLRDLHQLAVTRRSKGPKVESIQVRARLRGKSTIMAPADLVPYTQGLTVFQYDVVKVLSGSYKKAILNVAHWTVMEQQAVPLTSFSPGAIFDLRLELFDDNPQLAAENLSDDIVDDFSIPYFYDAGGASLQGSASLAPK